MKQKLNSWWRYFNGQSINIAFSANKMAPPGGSIKFVFHRSKSKFPTLSHAKKHFLHTSIAFFSRLKKSFWRSNFVEVWNLLNKRLSS